MPTSQMSNSSTTGARRSAPTEHKVFSISRVVNAPRQRVWDAFTKPEHLMRWWGPTGYTMEIAKVDLQVGGKYLYGMRSPAGNEMWGRFTYEVIEPIDFLSYVMSFSDEHAGVTRHPLSPDWPLEMVNQVTFTDLDGKTLISLEGWPIHATPEEAAVYDAHHPSMDAGYNGTFDKLDAYLASHINSGVE